MQDDAIIGFISALAGVYIELIKELEASESLVKNNIVKRLHSLQNTEKQLPSSVHGNALLKALIAAIEKNDDSQLKQLMH